ncbi:MAG TPA: hypothetical protein DCQ04_09875 [Actinobacteria bacterium]|nr:hypothetical protein [Actinomycetota bacterium]
MIVAGGVVVPKSIPLEGKRLVLKAKTVTNAGQKVKVSAKCTSRNRGDLTYCRLIRTSGGSTVLKTYGYHLKIRLVWKAPAANGYAAYKKVKYYTN